jgi:protein-tyrosine-phosphatase/predicted ATP-grasp superfamily ATP-dependent carboligase
MTREQFDLVLPTNDPTVIPLQLARDDLEPLGQVYLLNDLAFDTTFDKAKTRSLALANGVHVAPGDVVGSIEEAAAALDGRPYPVVIRPQFSFNRDDLDNRNSVTRAFGEEEARRAIAESLKRGLVLVEENVSGTGCGIEVLAASGEILLSQQHERVHEPLHGGQSSYRRTVPLDARLMEPVARLVRELDYTGVAMFEFKADPASGAWVLIEINGRFWGSLPLSLAAGIDFPYALWQLLVDGRMDFSNCYRTGVYCRNVKRDLKWLWLNARADRSDPLLATLPLSRVAAEMTHAVQRREHTDTFTVDDPRPGVAEFGQLSRQLMDVLRGRISEVSALRRRQNERARRALANANTILFVGGGNMCRSPFAEHFARRALASSVNTLSAGISQSYGARSPAIAREIALEFGVDLDEHRSREVTADLVEGADVIFAFDEGGRRELRRRYRHARAKVHLIGALGRGSLSVGDPLNRPADEFRQAYRQIAASLSEGRRR